MTYNQGIEGWCLYSVNSIKYIGTIWKQIFKLTDLLGPFLELEILKDTLWKIPYSIYEACWGNFSLKYLLAPLTEGYDGIIFFRGFKTDLFFNYFALVKLNDNLTKITFEISNR